MSGGMDGTFIFALGLCTVINCTINNTHECVLLSWFVGLLCMGDHA